MRRVLYTCKVDFGNLHSLTVLSNAKTLCLLKVLQNSLSSLDCQHVCTYLIR